MPFGWFKRKTAPAAGPQGEPRAAEVASFPAEKIAARAYEVWVRKGKPHGQEVQNWLEAEAELRAEFAANPDPAAPVRKSR
jgi:hypothetical protein